MYITSETRRSWVEIDLGRIASNYQIYRSHIPDGCAITAVVKADAYGHGDVAVSGMLQNLGVRSFAVSNIDEARVLRQNGIEGEILILGYTPAEDAEELIKYDITQALLSEEYAESLLSCGKKLKCQFAIDSGMNRIGLSSKDPCECERIIRYYAQRFTLTGLFTHLCVADSSAPGDKSFTDGQIGSFMEIARRVEDLKLPCVHCMNSAGGLAFSGGDSVRLGIILYGLSPDTKFNMPKGIEPALSWKSVVSMVKEIECGDSVGYGRSFTASERMRIATIPTGYADGYRRDLSNRGYVLIGGKRAPVVGRVCMDQMMVDVTDIPCRMGDEAILIGKSGNEVISADGMAEMIGTIGYEIICGISKRVPRKYME